MVINSEAHAPCAQSRFWVATTCKPQDQNQNAHHHENFKYHAKYKIQLSSEVTSRYVILTLLFQE